MEKGIRLKTLLKTTKAGETATLCGWVRSIRVSKNFSFLMLNDGSTFDSFQIVLAPQLSNYEEVSSLLLGSSITVTGKIVESQGKNQAFEMQAQEVKIICKTDATFPLQKKATSLEFLREIAHLRSRTNTFGAVFRVRNALALATHKFFNQREFFYLNTPIITGSDCEGAGEMFQVTKLDLKNPPKDQKGEIDFSKDYFAKSTNLTVSGQLEAECFAMGLGRVYTFGPTFRAENSNTPRHLSEFWMIEPEAAFFDLEDIAELAQDFVKTLIQTALDECLDELTFFDKHYENGLIERLKHVLTAGFKKITYREAIAILEEASTKKGVKFDFPVSFGVDLQTEHERYLTEKHFNSPVTVTDYPKKIKAFYMKQNPDGETVRAMDILVPGVGEIIGGSQREDNYEKLVARIEEMGLHKEDYWWYLDLRKYGSVPHSGFGLGFERAVMYITGMTNVRDVIAFPRTPGTAEF